MRTFALVVALALPLAACAHEGAVKPTPDPSPSDDAQTDTQEDQNPLFAPSALPYRAPDYAAIQLFAAMISAAEQLGAVSELPADEQRRLLARAAELRIDLRGLAAPNPDDNVRPLRSKERRWS